jgi:hypothetical protein
MNNESNNYNVNKLLDGKDAFTESTQNSIDIHNNKVRLEIFGEEMIEKTVVLSGNSGRAYLPPIWLGHKVKIVRID